MTGDTLTLTIRPEFFRLPTRGADPYFGLSRSYYYHLDATGQVLLVRIRNRGSQKGITLVNYQAMSAFLAKSAQSKTGESANLSSPPVAPIVAAAGNVFRLVNQYPKETDLLRKLAPALLYDALKTISALEEMVSAAGHSG